jgi:hypothetical protein
MLKRQALLLPWSQCPIATSVGAPFPELPGGHGGLLILDYDAMKDYHFVTSCV